MDSGGHRQKLGELAEAGGRWLLGRIVAGCFVLDHAHMGASCHSYGGSGRLGMRIGNTECPGSHITRVKPKVSIQNQNKPKPVVCPKLEQDPGARVRAQMEQ